jgi:serine/threonine-protein kinase
MGEVYLAHDPRLDREVALKFLALHLGGDEESRARFVRETRAVARLDHPNIVTLHEVGDQQGRPYLVMQYVDGVTLSEFARGRRLTVETVLDLGVQLCGGLQAAHEQGVVHRDLKPSNILVDSHLRARLVDFGVACITGGPRLTATGSLCGTVGYVSPEVVLGGDADVRSDIFSLGVVLFEALTGHLPFAATSAAAYGYAVVHEEPRPLTSDREDAPAGLEAALERALAKDPASRYQTAAEFGVDLARLLRQPDDEAPASRRRPAIAVLPFADMSPAHDQEYLCDGIAEELIHLLTRIEGLRVIARTSAFAFKGNPADVREIGRRLGVDTLLEGSVRTAGSRVRISAQLIDPKDGGHLWAERYDRELDDLFAIQDEVCLSIAERLKVTLLDAEKARVVKRRTRDAGAYTLYLKARFLFNQRTATSVRKSLEYYSQAIEADARFALAHAGMALAYDALATWRALPFEVAYAEARRCAAQAVELDEALAEGHVALGAIRMAADWDWRGAQRAFERALALNPSCADAHHMCAHLHQAMGRSAEALAEMDRALELEPVAPGLHSCLAEILFYAGRYDETVRQCGLTLEMAPSFAGVYGWMGMAHVLNGRAAVGLEALQEGLRQRPGDPRLEALLGAAFALAGRSDEARACIGRLDATPPEKYVDPYYRMWPHAARGDVGAALSWLARALEERSPWLYWLAVDPLLKGLRADPGFAPLAAKARLPD